MTRDEADVELVRSLAALRKAFHEGADDWRYRLLNTFYRYTKEIGIDSELTISIMFMRTEVEDVVRQKLAREAKTKNTIIPRNKLHPMAFAAAAVTFLKGSYEKVPDAVAAVARAVKLDKAELNNFRNNINRALAPKEALDAYKLYLAGLRDENWTKADVMSALKRARVFVKGTDSFNT